MMMVDENKDDNVKTQVRTRFEWLYGFTEKLTGALKNSVQFDLRFHDCSDCICIRC